MYHIGVLGDSAGELLWESGDAHTPINMRIADFMDPVLVASRNATGRTRPRLAIFEAVMPAESRPLAGRRKAGNGLRDVR